MPEELAPTLESPSRRMSRASTPPPSMLALTKKVSSFPPWAQAKLAAASGGGLAPETDPAEIDRLLQGLGAARPSRAGPGPRRAIRRKPCLCWKWLCPSPAILRCVCCLALASSAIIYSNARLWSGLSATAEAFGDLSEAAGNVAGAGANVTVQVAKLGIDVLNTASNTADELRRGVDVLNITLRRTTGKIGGRSPDQATLWVANRTHYPDIAVSYFADQLGSLSTGVPNVEGFNELVAINGSFVQMHIRGSLRADGTAAASIILLVADFDASWANPLWDMLGFNVQSEAPHIIEELKLALDKLGKVDAEIIDISDTALWRTFSMGLGFAAWLPSRKLLALSTVLLGTLGLYLLAPLRLLMWVKLRTLRRATSSRCRRALAVQWHSSCSGASDVSTVAEGEGGPGAADCYCVARG